MQKEETDARLKDAPLFSQSLTLNDARQKSLDACRIKPDRRFLLALQRLHMMFSKKGSVQVDCRWQNSRWKVFVAENQIGELSEFASFAEQMKLLESYAKQEIETNSPNTASTQTAFGLKFEGVERFSPSVLFETIRVAGNKWASGDRTFSHFENAEDVLIWLMMQNLDLMGVADNLCATTLATAAINDALGRKRFCENRCLLADSMGYYADAHTISALLEPTSAARNFIDGDLGKLQSIAKKQSKCVRTLYLLLRLAARKRDEILWRNVSAQIFALDNSLTLPLVRSVDEFKRTDMKMPLALNAIVAVNDEIDSGAKRQFKFNPQDYIWKSSYKRYEAVQEWMARDFVKVFEKAIDKLKTRERSLSKTVEPFDVVAIEEQFYRSYFDSAVRLLADCYLNLPSAQVWAEPFAQSLSIKGTKSPDPLERWFACRTLSAAGKVNPSSVEEQLNALAPFSTVAALDAIEVFGRSAGKRLFDCADARPSYRWRLADYCQSELLNVSLSQRLRLAQRENGQSNTITSSFEELISRRDPQKLLSLLADKRTDLSERLVAIETLSTLGVPRTRTRWQYKTVCDLYPYSRIAIERYGHFLLETNDYREAEGVLKQWLQRQTEFLFLDEVIVDVLLSKALTAQGKALEALKLLRSKQDITQLDLLCERARVHEILGQRADAEQWAKEVLAHYPNRIEALSTTLSILWKNGHYQNAALLLSEHRRNLPDIVWAQVIGSTFISIFGEKNAALMTAVGSLTDAGISDVETLGQMAHAAYVAQKPEAAFNMLSKVKLQDDHGAEMLTTAYRYLKGYESQAHSMDWLSKQLESEDRSVVAGPAFISGQYDLLWKFIPMKPAKDAEKVWLLRAAACCLDKENLEERLEAVRIYTKSSNSFDAKLAAYLVDPTDDEILSQPLTEDQYSRAAFFVGWKKLTTTSSFVEATEWLNVSLLANKISVEASWARIWLQDIVRTLRNYSTDLQTSGIKSLKVFPPAKFGDWDSRRRFKIRAVK